jgi:hypothetical protein
MLIGNVKNIRRKNFILQQTGGCVLGLSLYQLHPRALQCIRVRRISDDVEIDVGFRDGFVDFSTLNTFLSGTSGAVTTWYNQAQVSGVTNAVQAIGSAQPTCDDLRKGIKFNGSSQFMTLGLYAELNIKNNPLIFYTNHYKTEATTGYLLCKNSTSNADRQYAFLTLGLSPISNRMQYVLDGTNRVNIDSSAPRVKILARWQSGRIYFDTQTTNGSAAYATPLTQTGAACFVGCRGDPDGAQVGHINGYQTTILLFNAEKSVFLWECIRKLGV